MFKDFEKAKTQLSELAEIVNSFKSEAVQLRIIELLFKGAVAQGETNEQPALNHLDRRNARRKPRRVASSKGTGGDNQKKRGPSGRGPQATLTQLHASGFFNTPRTISAILTHCETNLARRIKANDISGKLARLVSEGELKRTKNADNQYEYSNP